jgi:FkbM family methyltransferase
MKISSDRGIEIDWILEAGCHDGSDTYKLFSFYSPARYLAFEPDETARLKAKALFDEQKLRTIELYPTGLSSENTTKFLRYAATGKGSGSTHFSEVGEDLISVRVFDDHYKVHESSGLLWLDVEGHTIPALTGMVKSLHKISVARIEVQLHTRSKDFSQDFIEVIQLMKQASLVPVYGPIYPGFFGDIIFIKKTMLTFRDKARHYLLMLHMKFLHLFLYPRIKKPSVGR